VPEASQSEQVSAGGQLFPLRMVGLALSVPDDSVHPGLHASAPLLRIILPPGISFYTFREVAYIVDVYEGKLPASRSFLDYGLFIRGFPHLIAGPIQRPLRLLPQVRRPRQ
jgi:D-alanyl-lipoteichoic acid acyltransferase DltB (MBOAT superfamily)